MNLTDYLINKHGGRSKSGDKDEVVMDCPNCGKADNHFSFNVRKGVGNCYRCSYHPRSATVLIQKLDGVDKETAELIAIYGNDSGSKAEAVIELLGRKTETRDEFVPHKNASLPKEFQLMVDALREPRVLIPTDFMKRGYSVEALKKFRVGFCSEGDYKSRVIFPVECEDNTSFVARRIHDYMDKKYKNPMDSKHEQLLYNYNRLPDGGQIFICEGVTDVLRMESHGFHATATFGKKISTYQIQLIQKLNPKEVIVCFDGDAIDSNRRAFDRLSYRVNTSFILLPKKPNQDKYYDPDDVPKMTLYACIHERIGMSKLQNSIRILSEIVN